MKKLLSIFLLAFTLPVCATPDWFSQRTISAADNELIGYGSGKTLEAARTRASQDIAYQLGVDIDVTINRKTELRNQQLDQRYREQIQSKTKQRLRNLEIVKSEKDGPWFVVVKASAVPYWYSERLLKAGPDLKVGYGSDKDLRRAQLHAAEEIALQFGGKIKVKTTSSSSVRNDQLEQQFDQDIQIDSEQNLGAIRLLNTQKVKNTWYVVAEIGDRRHFSQKLIDKLKGNARACSGLQSVYLAQQPSIQRVNQALNCAPALTLSKVNGHWYLSAADLRQQLTSEEFSELMLPRQVEGLFVSSSKSTVYEAEAYTLNIQAKQPGYVSCFIVYEDGHVALLFDNEKIDANRAMIFPDPKSGLELVAELPKRGIKTTDLYIVVQTQTPRSFSEFEEMTTSIQNAADAVRFGKLVERIQMRFASTLIHTLPLSRQIR